MYIGRDKLTANSINRHFSDSPAPTGSTKKNKIKACRDLGLFGEMITSTVSLPDVVRCHCKVSVSLLHQRALSAAE